MLLIDMSGAEPFKVCFYQAAVTQFNLVRVNKLFLIKLRHIVSSGRRLMIKVTVFFDAFRLDDAPVGLRRQF